MRYTYRKVRTLNALRRTYPLAMPLDDLVRSLSVLRSKGPYLYVVGRLVGEGYVEVRRIRDQRYVHLTGHGVALCNSLWTPRDTAWWTEDAERKLA